MSNPKYDRRRLRGIARLIVSNPNITIDLSDLESEDLERLHEYIEERKRESKLGG